MNRGLFHKLWWEAEEQDSHVDEMRSLTWAFVEGYDLRRLKSCWWKLSINPWHAHLVALSCFFTLVVLAIVVLSPYRFRRGQTHSKSSGQSMGRFKAPGVPGGPGQPAPGPVEEGYKSRAGPACLFTLHPCTPQEELEVIPNNQAMSSQPCSQRFPCTGTQAGLPTAAVVGSWWERPDPVDKGTFISYNDGPSSGKKSNGFKSLYLQLEFLTCQGCSFIFTLE